MAKTVVKPPARKAASKSNTEETKQSSDESFESESSDRKMAAKTTKTKTKTPKAKPLTKDTPNRHKQPDPPAIDSDQVEGIQTIPAPYPAKPARASKTLCMKYYKKRAHYYQRKFEGATSDIGVFSDIYYSSSEEERGMTQDYTVTNSNGTTLSK